MGLITELKRRNVFRVAVAYAVIAWFLAQVADLAFDNFGAPDWVPKSVLFVLALGFPLAIIFAWAFEMTPEGVKKEKDVDRSQSITQKTGRKLNYLIIAVLVAAIGVLLADKFLLREVTPSLTTDSTVAAVTDKSVAVLPFVAMSSGPDDEYFADGLTEEILNSLAQLPELLVTARTSAFTFKGQDLPIPEVAAKLGVAHVVEGSVRRAGERLRITAQLIRASDGFHLWSETYERSGEDSFRVQGEIAEKVAAALDVVLDEEQLASMRSSGLRNPEAFIAYQKGVQLSSGAHAVAGDEQVAALLAANEFFERTIELEPGFSSAHFNHGDYYVHFVVNAEDPGEISAEVAAALELAEKDFRNAARTARSDGDRLNATLESTLMSKQWRRLPELFAAAYRSTDCISPSWWGAVPTILDPSEGALALWQRAVACDPMSFYNWVNVAELQESLGDYQASIDTAKRALAVIPHRQIAEQLISAYMAAGQFDDAAAASQRYLEDEQRRHDHRFRFAAAMGNATEAQALHDEAVEKYGVEALDHFSILGDRDEANRLAAVQDTYPLGFLALLDTVSICDCGAPFDLDATPNFARLIEEANLPWPPPSPIDWPLKNW
jgi:adenylate cyclase